MRKNIGQYTSLENFCMIIAAGKIGLTMGV